MHDKVCFYCENHGLPYFSPPKIELRPLKNTYYLDGAAYCKEGGVVKEINLQVMRNIKVGLPSFLFLARNQNLA